MTATVAVFGVASVFGLAVLLGRVLVPRLAQWKLGQEIREDGPERHREKAGTPTMGGAIFLLPVLAVSLLLPWREIWLPALALLSFGLLGFLDDWQKIRKRENEGLSVRQKFAGQIGLALGLSLLLYAADPASRPLFLFSGSLVVQPGWAKIALDTLMLVSVANACNLTDGLDGLAALTAAPVLLALAGIAVLLGRTGQAFFLVCFVAALAGFLVYNRHPARVFMGDTGSLALGAGMGAVAMQLGLSVSLVLLGGLFVVVTASVILQVAYFRATGGARLFRMAPLHHHFELSGWPEKRVVGVFALGSSLFAGLGFLVFWLC